MPAGEDLSGEPWELRQVVVVVEHAEDEDDEPADQQTGRLAETERVAQRRQQHRGDEGGEQRDVERDAAEGRRRRAVHLPIDGDVEPAEADDDRPQRPA